MVSTEHKSYSKRLLQLISWSHWFTFFNVWVALAFSAVYLFTEPLPDSFLGLSYLAATWLSHMAFLTFISFVLIVFPLTLLIPRTRVIRTAASVIFTFGLLLLALDAFIYSRLGYHLNASSKDQIIALISNQISVNSVMFWFVSVVLFLVVLAFQLIVSNYAWKHLKQLQQTRFARKIVIGFVSAFFFSHIVHIWADAKLDYDVLKQDTLLPLSYPTTAKALLTKYGLFNRANYMARRNSPLTFTEKVTHYPNMTRLCALPQPVSKPIKQSVFLILTDKLISKADISAVTQHALVNAVSFNHHIDNALRPQAWFNLFYSLPSIYQADILALQQKPALFQLMNQQKIESTFTEINTSQSNVSNPSQVSAQNSEQSSIPQWLSSQFSAVNTKKDIADLVFSNQLSDLPVGLHVVYFKTKNNYQFELFIDALMLAQRNKTNPDIIWISSLGNSSQATSLTNKSAYLIWPNKHSHTMDYLTSQMDVMPTLIHHWLNCPVNSSRYSTGSDLLTLKQNRVIANTMTDGMMVFNKDKSVFIDQNGNFQSFSRQLNSPIMENADFPLMIDGVHYIKQFSQQQLTKK